MANVTFTPNHQPAPACYPSDINGLLDTLTTGGGLSGTIPDNSGGGIFVGSTPPSSSLTNKVWFKTDAAGRPLGVYMFYNGNWRKVYTGVARGEIRLYIGTQSVFDASGLGIIGGDVDGWALCNGNNGTPDLLGSFPACGARGSDVSQPDGWYTDAEEAGTFLNSGGQKTRIILTTDNLPTQQVVTHYTTFNFQIGPTLSQLLLVADPAKTPYPIAVQDTGTGLQGGSTPLPFQNAYVAMAFMMFVGYA